MERQIKNKDFKILAAGDIHGDVELTKKLADKAKEENVDLVILTGDITFLDNPVKGIIEPFSKIGKKVLIIPGNHEPIATIDFFTQAYKNIQNIHGSYIKIGDIGIFGAGGADTGPFSRISDYEIYKLLKKGFEKLKNTKIRIMATHAHPSNSLIERIAPGFKGNKGIEMAIKTFKPEIALCSHIHEAWGIEEKIGNTKLINVGREGKIIEISC